MARTKQTARKYSPIFASHRLHRRRRSLWCSSQSDFATATHRGFALTALHITTTLHHH